MIPGSRSEKLGKEWRKTHKGYVNELIITVSSWGSVLLRYHTDTAQDGSTNVQLRHFDPPLSWSFLQRHQFLFRDALPEKVFLSVRRSPEAEKQESCLRRMPEVGSVWRAPVLPAALTPGLRGPVRGLSVSDTYWCLLNTLDYLLINITYSSPADTPTFLWSLPTPSPQEFWGCHGHAFSFTFDPFFFFFNNIVLFLIILAALISGTICLFFVDVLF